METYKYSCKLSDFLIYDFTLIIDNHRTRFKDEGIIQQVLLIDQNNHCYFDNNWGREYAHEYFRLIDNVTIGCEWEFWHDDVFNDFKDWILNALSPLPVQRKVKLSKIKDKLNATISY